MKGVEWGPQKTFVYWGPAYASLLGKGVLGDVIKHLQMKLSWIIPIGPKSYDRNPNK